MEREITIEEVRQICGESFRNYIDDYVKALLYFKDQGEKVYCNFNGHILHSETVTYDSAYIEVTGRPKSYFDTETEELKR